MNIKQIKKFEGRKITKLAEGDLPERTGIITDVVVLDAPGNRGELRGIVLWDDDEFEYMEEGIRCIHFDMGVADYPLLALMNKDRFHIT